MSNNNDTKKNSIYYLLFFSLLCFSQLLSAATITVRADRNPIVLNEQFTLTFSADANPAGDPDFSPLNQDFDVIRQGKSSSVQMINGNVTQNIAWNLSLYPKTAGQIKIPAIQFGSDKSPETTITVSATPVAPQGQAGQVTQDIFIEAEIAPKTAYVQQQMVYIQRLYFDRDFFDNATLSTPQVKTGKIDIEKLGDGREYTKEKDGRQYRVIERRYAIFPIQSGKLEIAPTFFEGRLIENSAQQRPSFGFFNRPRGKVVRRYSPAITVDVKPQSSAYKGKHWLPATNVTLHANWSTPPEQAKTGEPLTLTIGIIANGLRAEQLPALTVDVPAGLKTYNDQPVLHNESNSNEIIATRQEKVVVVAAKSGEFVIPEITLSWWNTKTESQELAKIPASKVIATGAAIQNTPVKQPVPTPVPVEENKPDKSATSTAPQAIITPPTTEEKTPSNTVATTTSTGNNIWFYISLLLILLLALTLFLLWKQTATKTKMSEKPVAVARRSATETLKLIQKACVSNDHKALRDALIEWGEVYLKLPNANLQTIMAAVTTPEFKHEIQHLMGALYASEKVDWNSKKLCEQVLAYRTKKRQAKPSSRISALYPDE